jgi:hypothetical protein
MIQSWTNLWRKKVVDTAVCEICQQDKEIVEHVIKGCPFVREFWAKIGFSFPFVSFGVVGDIYNVNCLSSFLLLAAVEAQEWDYLQV